MLKKINKKLFLAIIVLTVFLLPLFSLAYDFNEESGLKSAAEGTGHAGFLIYNADDEYPEIAVLIIIINIINVVLSFLGVLFLLLMMYGGYIWLTAQGNEQQIEKAKRIIVSAIIGVAVVVIAYAISWLLVNLFGAQTLKK